MNKEENTLLYKYIQELNEEAGLVDNVSIDKLFAKLVALEKSFESKMRKSSRGKKIYGLFINMIYKSNRGMISLRPYFRQRENLFLETINKAIEHNRPEQLHGSPINYRFITFAMNTLDSQILNIESVKDREKIKNDVNYRELTEIFNNIKETRDEIIKNNLFLALGRAKIHSRSSYSSSIDFSDLIQISNEALIVAVDKYVPDSKSVFAHMAIGRIIAQLIADGSSPSSATVNSSGKKKLYKIRKVLEKAPGSTREQVANILNIAEMEVNELIESTHHSSLDQPLFEDDTRTLGDRIEDNKSNAHVDIENKDLFIKLLKAYEVLSVIELKILRLKGVNPMRTLNRQVAITMPKKKEELTKESKNFVMLDHLTQSLVESDVVFDSEKFKSGDKVYFRADSLNQHVLRQKYSFAGKEFVLVPEEWVVALEG